MAAPIGFFKNPTWDLNKSKYEEVDSLPFMTNPGPILLLVAGYLLFVLKLGPIYMRKREAFKLTNTLLIYNAFQVIFSVYLTQQYAGLLLKYGLLTKECLFNKPEKRPELILGIWLYFVAKVTELLDTVFFILRKKDKQVTFLHLYHHTIMMAGTWAFLKYSPSGNVIYIGFINSLVHVFMYTYYGLAALGPNVAKYLTWKKYMTSFQLVQFVTVLIQYISSLRYSECPPSRGVAIFFSFNTLFFLFLFSNFYRQSYVKRKTVRESNAIKTAVNGTSIPTKSE